jgi:hypothetical protein
MPRRSRPYMATRKERSAQNKAELAALRTGRTELLNSLLPPAKEAEFIRESPELKEHIVDAIASGRMISHLAREPGFPSRRSISRWRRQDPEFHQAMTEAESLRSEQFAEMMVDVAFDTSGDFDKDGKPIWDQPTRAKIKVESLKFMAAKYNPRFEDKNHTVLSGDANNPIAIQQEVNMEKRLEVFMAFLNRAERDQPPRELSGFGRPVIQHQPKPKISDKQWTEYVQRIANGEQAEKG